MYKLLFATFVLLAFSSTVVAENIETIFQRVNKLVSSEDYSKALNELTWARKEIEKMHISKLTSLLPNTVLGFTGSQAKTEGMLGFTNIEREYSKGSERVNLSLTGSSGSDVGGAGGLAGLGRMAAMMGANAPGSDTFRIDGRTAQMEQGSPSSLNPSITLFLNSGSILELKGRNIKASALRSFAEGINVTQLDQYLSGQGARAR